MESIRSEKGLELLDTVDRLRSLGVDHYIPLPQIIVVGQQSAGKSSVLEAISGAAFPINDGFCTQFATELVLRRAPKERTEVEILLDNPGADPELQQRVKEFERRQSARNAESPIANLPDVVAAASEAMGVSSSNDICKNKLRIEIHSPKQDHLTLVDLPGLVSMSKPTQIANVDNLVRQLALGYMKQPRSIILAVLSAKTDYVTQDILRLVKSVDPSGSRTMGIITGLDLVDKDTQREKEYRALAQNTEWPLKLGWHVLRNPSHKERRDPNLDRAQLEEDLFSMDMWKDLNKEHCGAARLKARLSDILMKHVGRELNNVIVSLDRNITSCEVILDKLGPDRTTVQAQRQFLANIGKKHEPLVRAALEGKYKDKFFSETDQKLRAKIRTANEAFAKEMLFLGHRWEIVDDSRLETDAWVALKAIGDKVQKDQERVPVHIRKVKYLFKVQDVLEKEKGLELQGSYDPKHIGTLFRDQSCRWESLATKHIRRILGDVELFIETVTQHVAGAKRAKILLSQRLNPMMREREAALASKISEVLSPFGDDSEPMTCNPRYTETLSRRRGGNDIKPEIAEPNKLQIDTIACEDLLERMCCYYDIALAVFIDNIVTLGIERCLLKGLDNLLSPMSVLTMTDEEVELLAGEFPEDQKLRKETTEKLERLRAGMRECQKHVEIGSPLLAPAPETELETNHLPEGDKVAVGGPVDNVEHLGTLDTKPRQRTPSRSPRGSNRRSKETSSSPFLEPGTAERRGSSISRTPTTPPSHLTPGSSVSPLDAFSKPQKAGLGSAPTAAFGSQSTTGFGSAPAATFGSQSTTGFGSQSTASFSSAPTAVFGSQPKAAPDFQPKSLFGFGTTTGFGSAPTAAPDSRPKPAFGSAVSGLKFSPRPKLTVDPEEEL